MAKENNLLIAGILGVLLLAFGWYKLSPKRKSSEATEDAGASSGGGGGGGSVGDSSTNTTTPVIPPPVIPPPTFIPHVITRTPVNPLIHAVASRTRPVADIRITGSDKDDEFLISMEQTL